MKIGIAQVNPTIGDFTRNFNLIRDAAERARGLGCDMVVFSELVITGYPPRDLLEKSDFVRTNLKCLNRLVETIRGIGVICGYAEPNPGAQGNNLFNAAALFEDGRILHRAYKRLLPTYDVFDERRYFEPGEDLSLFNYKGHRMALTVCEDAWNDTDVFKRQIYRLDPVKVMCGNGADLVINVSASPFHVGKKAFRWHMLGAIAKKYGVPLVYTNQAGGNDSVLFDGASTAFNPDGEVVARARDFAEDLVVFDSKAMTGDLHPVSDSDIETVYKGLVLGTRDYMRKCGFKQVVLGLSGGIDSALVACVAAAAAGPENVFTVFMPSRYTSRDNYEDTKQLADNLGVFYQVIPIDGIFGAFTKELSPNFDPESPGVTEQNIQARTRGTLLMGLSNAHGYLVLSTGNKSEMAIGYCTLYGDMNGGLSVLSDVPKTMVYELAHYINRGGEAIPDRIIQKAPSAELKPNQTDQDDLPPYEVLDQVLKGYIEEYKGVEDLVAMGHDRNLVLDVARRVDQNEYKRQQAPPGIKVTSKAFGYGRRFPIAQQFRGGGAFDEGKQDAQ